MTPDPGLLVKKRIQLRSFCSIDLATYSFSTIFVLID